jgi:hypothetical protein
MLESQRLYATCPKRSDLNNWRALLLDADVTQYIGNGAPKRNHQIKRLLKNAISHNRNHGFSLFNIFEKKDNAFLGEAGLIHLAFNKNSRDIELSYTLKKQ